jgi:hypothetical protein
VHPDDSASLVSDAVAELIARAALAPDLGVGTIELRDRFLIYAPIRVLVRHSISVQEATGLILPGGQTLQHQLNIPDLGRQPENRDLIVLARCDGFDSHPPLVELLAGDGTPLAPDRWPKDPRGRGIVPQHHLYGRPFFCRPRVREYHEHVQHEDDPWDKYREGASLAGIIIGIVRDLKGRFVLT